MLQVAVTDALFDDDYQIERTIFERNDISLEIYRSVAEFFQKSKVENCSALLVNLDKIDSSHIDRLHSCKIIQRYGVGTDNVDVDAATRKGIWVGNVPDYSIEDVSDHAIGLIFASARQIAFNDRSMRAGIRHLANKQPCYRITGKVLGICGFGSIARRLAQKVAGFGFVDILVSDPFVSEDIIRSLGAKKVSIDQLMSESDFVTLHLPLNDHTEGIIGKDEIELMKPTAILVNTSRGRIVDEVALTHALHTGRIGGAGLDVFQEEPLSLESPLSRLDNVVLSDHIGWNSVESIIELRTKVSQNVTTALTNGEPIYSVNQV